MKWAILGSGGHSRSVASLLRLAAVHELNFFDILGEQILDFNLDAGVDLEAVIRGHLERLDPGDLQWANGIGLSFGVGMRDDVYMLLARRMFHFPPMIHPAAIVDPSCVIGGGAQIFAGAIVACGSVVEENAVVHSGAVIEHDCVISRSAFIAPGAVLCGSVSIGSRCLVGAGATILPNSVVPDGATVKAHSLFRSNS